MFGSNCCFLTCIQISQAAGKVVWHSHLLKHLPQFVVIHTVKGFGIVNKSEVDVLLEFSCFFYDPTDVGNLISGSSAFSKSNLNIWKFAVHVLLKPGLENFKHYFTSVWDKCNCAFFFKFFSQQTLTISPHSSEITLHDKLINLIQWKVFKQARQPEPCLNQRSLRETAKDQCSKAHLSQNNQP